MTLLAGAFGRRAGIALDPALGAQIERVLSRHGGDVADVYRDDRCFLAKVDIGVFGAAGFHADPEGSVTLLTGDPLLASRRARTGRTRSDDLAVLHRAGSRGEWGALVDARGVFSAVHYSARAAQLTLVTDKLGLRPIYYWIGADLVVFASALRVLEQLSAVPKTMDLRGIIEQETLGVPLAARTPYAEIALLRAAEVLEVADGTLSRTQYWRWDDLAPIARVDDAAVDEAYARFEQAVDLRLGDDDPVAAFLTGGLDSRCVATALRARGRTVHTFNFSRPGNQDHWVSQEFARRVGSIHHRRAYVHTQTNATYAFTMAAALEALPPEHADFPRIPRRVWSGDGGSIGVGHVRVERDVVALLRAGQQRDAVLRFLDHQQAHIPKRLFRPDVAVELDAVTARGIGEELDALRCGDPGRAFHLFLMLNDQRRHLTDHFEHIDLHRLEYHLPFYDSDFLAFVIALPLDACLGHGFYSRWLERFPGVARSVPWQTYPGHDPCPLPMPSGLSYQWHHRGSPFGRTRRRKRGRQLHAARAALQARDFPSGLLRRRDATLMYWMYRLGLRDYGYAMEYLALLHSLWSRTHGAYMLPQKTSE